MPGLTAAEAHARLVRDGPNVLPGTPQWGALRIVVHTIVDPMALLLVFAGVVYFAVGDFLDATIALLALIPVVGVAVVLDTRASRALHELARLGARRARVWRDGELVDLDAALLVVGDVVDCVEGDVAPADLDCLSTRHAFVDRSLITGESLPEPLSVGECFLAGTVLVTGQMTGEVSAIGSTTEMGKIGALLGERSVRSSPLERATHRWVRRLSAIAVLMAVFVGAVQFAYGQSVTNAVIAGVALGLAAIPEEIPIVLAIYRALAAVDLARRHALVRNLDALEMLGAVDVICTDKTGTLTEGRIGVACVVDAAGVVHAIDQGLTEPGIFVIETARQASEQIPFDPLEQALQQVATDRALGIEKSLVLDFPFTPEMRASMHVWREHGSFRLAWKGALAAYLDAHPEDKQAAGIFTELETSLASAGMRVLAVAAASTNELPSGRQDAESQTHLVGLIGFRDPVRPEVAESVAQCRAAGVQVVMLTGDHAATAHAIAEAAGIAHEHDATSSGEILALEPGLRAEAIQRRALISRVAPQDKLAIVKALQEEGCLVGMTGDGVNDAPALRQADVGIAMGTRGTQVAREAADVVLLDDAFPSIVAGITAGRATVIRLRRAMTYLIAYHVPVLSIAIFLPLFNVSLLLLPAQILLLEIVLHPTVALVFQADPVRPERIARRPMRGGWLASRAEIVGALAMGALLAIATLAVYFLARRQLPEPNARAAGFIVLLAGQVVIMCASRSPRVPWWRVRPFWTVPVRWLIAGNAALVITMVTVPFVARVLHLGSLTPIWFVAAVCVGVLAPSGVALVGVVLVQWRKTAVQLG
ncbi:MAG: cation-translocating P-type ATPase [Acidimicrobiia bacterium]